MMTVRVYESLSALSSVSTFVLLVRVVLLRLIFFFSLSFSLAFDRPIICSFSLLQKADSPLYIMFALRTTWQ